MASGKLSPQDKKDLEKFTKCADGIEAFFVRIRLGELPCKMIPRVKKFCIVLPLNSSVLHLVGVRNCLQWYNEK
jgi:hypothetical protein